MEASTSFMALTLRPTGLSPRPDANDWSIHEDGGRTAGSGSCPNLTHAVS